MDEESRGPWTEEVEASSAKAGRAPGRHYLLTSSNFSFAHRAAWPCVVPSSRPALAPHRLMGAGPACIPENRPEVSERPVLTFHFLRVVIVFGPVELGQFL